MSAQAVTEDIDIEKIEELIDKYANLSKRDRKDKDESKVRQHYINPLLRALGWDTESDQVIPEQRTVTGDADYALAANGREQYYIETKRFRKGLDGSRRVRGEKQSYVEQAVDYAWHQGCDWAVLTNFKELRLYFTHVSKDNLEDGHIFTLTYDEYTDPEGITNLVKLSKEAVINGSLTSLEKRRERESVTTEILNDLSDSRVALTRDIHDSHPDLPLDEVREGVQRILDRLVVLRVAEDRRVVSSDKILNHVKYWENNTINKQNHPLVKNLKSDFRDFHATYNSVLFEEHPCEDYEISNDVLKDIIYRLYDYKFDYISTDILGSIYEDYIGHAIEDKDGDLELISQQDTRREGVSTTHLYRS